MIERWIAYLARKFNWNPTVPSLDNDPIIPVTVKPMSKIYDTAKSLIGQHLTLNENVAPEVGCAEAVSFVLRQAGYPIPHEGIASTAALYTWLPQNGFTREVIPLPGDIICSPTGLGNGKVRGHVGVVAQYGILSNDSNSGLFLELWTLDKWNQYYGAYGGLPIALFRAVDASK